MSELRCALVDASGTVSNVVVCCGGNPAICSLKPVRITAAMGPVSPGYASDGKGGFTAPSSASSTPPVLDASATAAGTTATVAVTR